MDQYRQLYHVYARDSLNEMKARKGEDIPYFNQ